MNQPFCKKTYPDQSSLIWSVDVCSKSEQHFCQKTFGIIWCSTKWQDMHTFGQSRSFFTFLLLWRRWNLFVNVNLSCLVNLRLRPPIDLPNIGSKWGREVELEHLFNQDRFQSYLASYSIEDVCTSEGHGRKSTTMLWLSPCQSKAFCKQKCEATQIVGNECMTCITLYYI